MEGKGLENEVRTRSQGPTGHGEVSPLRVLENQWIKLLFGGSILKVCSGNHEYHVIWELIRTANSQTPPQTSAGIYLLTRSPVAPVHIAG